MYPRRASCTPEAAGLHGIERLPATVALLFLSSAGLALCRRGQGKGGIFVIFIFLALVAPVVFRALALERHLNDGDHVVLLLLGSHLHLLRLRALVLLLLGATSNGEVSPIAVMAVMAWSGECYLDDATLLAVVR